MLCQFTREGKPLVVNIDPTEVLVIRSGWDGTTIVMNGPNKTEPQFFVVEETVEQICKVLKVKPIVVGEQEPVIGTKPDH